MTIEVDGEIYYSASEAIEYLGVSRDTFYRRLKTHRIPQYRHGILQRVHYRQSDLDALKVWRPIRQEEEQ